MVDSPGQERFSGSAILGVLIALLVFTFVCGGLTLVKLLMGG